MNIDDARGLLWDEARHGCMHPNRRQALEVLLDEQDRLSALGGSEGAERIATERRRQIRAEGWTPEHDDEHDGDELAWAAVCYAAPPDVQIYADVSGPSERPRLQDPWPWSSGWDKRPKYDCTPAERIRGLEKAGALCAAEIDRLLRAKKATP